MLTSLESIAEKLQEARRQKLEEILSVSGSDALARNDETGITTVNEKNIATNLLFKPLNKQKLDNSEITKAIDIQISELKPEIPTQAPETVSKELYDEQVIVNENLSNENQNLNDRALELSEKLENLKLEVETQIINADGNDQTMIIIRNQNDTLNGSIAEVTQKVTDALNKSIEENAIRNALQAQNQGYQTQIRNLIDQIDSLNAIIDRLQSQLGAVQQQVVPDLLINTTPVRPTTTSITAGTITSNPTNITPKPAVVTSGGGGGRTTSKLVEDLAVTSDINRTNTNVGRSRDGGPIRML
jgi:hypothetical protein